MNNFSNLDKIKIAVAGTGYVGMSVATLLAQHHEVIAVDIIPEKIEKINNKISPIQDKEIEQYLADNDFANLSGDSLKEAIKGYIKEKDDKAASLKGTMVTQGTTPRQLTDLIGSLADLTSGSGDKGTPIIYIQGYFDNYTK